MCLFIMGPGSRRQLPYAIRKALTTIALFVMSIPVLLPAFPCPIKHPEQSGLSCRNPGGKLVVWGVPSARDNKQMRAKFIAAIGLLACFGLAGCDNSGNAPAPTAQVTAQPCNCQTQNAAAVQPAPIRATHRHSRIASTREYEEHYSAGSSSRSYDQDAAEDQPARQSGNAEENVWVDGYGRSHYAASAAPAPDEHARLAPWHGYDEKCDEKDKP